MKNQVKTKTKTPPPRRRKPSRENAAAPRAQKAPAISANVVHITQTKSVIVYGPQGSGKTKNAAALAAHFGLTKIIDGDWTPGDRIPKTGALILTNTDLSALREQGEIRRAYPIDEALQLIAPRPIAIQPSTPQPNTVQLSTPTAPEILIGAADLIDAHAASRDKLTGERSMRRAVDAFNALTGHKLSEVDGSLLMVMLKAARATVGTYAPDDFTDMAAYAAMAGEQAAAAHL